MKDVSPQARSYLDALRTADAPAAGASARVWDGVQARAAAGDLGPDLGPDLPAEPSGLATGAGATSTSIKSIVLGVLVGTGVAIGGAAAIVGSTPDDPAPTVASPEVAVAVPTIPEEITLPEPSPTPVVEPPMVDDEEPIEIEDEPAADTSPVEARPRTKATRPRPDATPTAAPEPSVDPVAEEVALLADARSALGAGEASRAIAVLARHRKRFPEGMLARERDVSWITALCVLGRTDEARTKAKAFLRAHGSSPHAAKVRASCGGKD